MGIIRSTEGYLGFGKQDGHGTAVPPTEFIYLSGAESIEITQDYEQYHEQTGERFPTVTLKKTHKHDGGFPMFCRPDISGFLTAMFLGADTMGGTATPYSHVLTVADTIPWMTVEREVGDADVDGLLERIADCKFDTLTISAEVGEPVIMEMSFLGTRGVVETSPATATPHDVQTPFIFSNGAFTLTDGETTEVTAFSVAMSNNLAGDIFSSEITREDILEGDFTIDLTFTLKFVDTDHYKNVYYGGTDGTTPQTDLYSGNFVVDLTYGTDTAERAYKIDIAKLFFVAAPVHLTNEAVPIYQDCDGYMVEPDAGEPLTITVKNTDDAEYL